MTAPTPPPSTTASTRIMAGVVLAGVASTVFYGGLQVYRVATDSFVAPIILSPDNDAVIASKLGHAQLLVERARTAAEIDGIEADLAAGATAIGRLEALTRTVGDSLAWSRDVNRQLASKSASQLRTLAEQASLLRTMIGEQERISKDAAASLEAGLISRDDHQKEVLSLNQLRLTLLENERAQAEEGAEMKQVQLAQDSLSHQGKAPAMPERIMREDQLVRIELEILKLQSEQRTKETARRLDQEKLAKVDELEAQLQSRPIFRASHQSLDVAFVPYTQSAGVSQGAAVFKCTWGLIACNRVGTVAELVPGEVILPDPWGNQARGQYAILTLEDRTAATEKTLRVRAAR